MARPFGKKEMIDFSKYKQKVIVVFIIILAIICLLITLGTNNQSFRSFLGNVRFSYQRCVDSDGAYAFYNVDNADASMVYTNRTIGLIDTGLKETVGVITRHLSDLKTKTLDFVVISHPHSDHAGGYLELLKQIEIKRLFIVKYDQNAFENISLYNEIIKISREKGIEIIYATHGTNIKIGDISLLFWDGSHSSTDENHNSLLVKVQIGKTSCLYTGDAGKQAESYLLSLGCDVSADILKVGHHGSNTASSKDFLQAVTPLYSIISVGYNEYGHPHQETLERLMNIGTKVYRTDICEKILFEVQDDIIDVTVD